MRFRSFDQSGTAVLLASLVLLVASVPAGLNLSGCRAGGPAVRLLDIKLAQDPPPVVSEGLGQVVFLSSDGRVFAWTVGKGDETPSDTGLTIRVKPVFTADPEWSIRAMALSPDARRPYLALTETFRGGTGAATRVVVVNTTTGQARRVLPIPEFGPEVSSLQWSADGRRLFVDGKPPLVLDIEEDAAEVTWDLTAMAPAGSDTEARRPLLAPDFSAAAFTRFYLSATEDEDLWVLREDESVADRLTAGNLGGYPVAWLGGAADGSKPGGPFDYLLVQTGAISTGGGGAPQGLAVVNVQTKTLTVWYGRPAPGQDQGEGAAEGPPAPAGTGTGADRLTFRAVLVDLPGGRVLINSFDAMTGENGRAFWRSLTDGAETEIPELAGRHVTTATRGHQESPAAVLLARQPGEVGYELWVLESSGPARKLAGVTTAIGGLPDGMPDLYLLGVAGPWYVLLEVVPAAGTGPNPPAARTALLALDPAEGKLKPVLTAETGK